MAFPVHLAMMDIILQKMENVSIPKIVKNLKKDYPFVKNVMKISIY